MHMRAASQPMWQGRVLPSQRLVQRTCTLPRLAVRSMQSRPGFEPVEDGALRSTDKESQAVYEYSTHQGLDMEEIEDDEAEVRVAVVCARVSDGCTCVIRATCPHQSTCGVPVNMAAPSSYDERMTSGIGIVIEVLLTSWHRLTFWEKALQETCIWLAANGSTALEMSWGCRL